MIHVATEAEIEDPTYIPLNPIPELYRFEDKKRQARAQAIMQALREEAERVWAERERRGLPGRSRRRRAS